MIGQGLDKAKISAKLDACLLSEKEFAAFAAGPKAWASQEGHEDPIQMVVMQGMATVAQ